MRKTKIVATVGPSCWEPELLRDMILKGVNVFRLNMSHALQENVGKRVSDIREQAKEVGRNVAIMMDVQGPKIRVGMFKKGQVLLEVGQTFIFDQNPEEGDESRVNTTYKTVHKDVKVGDLILLDDGKLELIVQDIQDDRVIAEVIIGGILKNKKGMNLPDVKIGLPPLTEKDIKDLKLGCTLDIDYVAMSFVQRAQDITYLRNILKMEKREDIRIIAKIEKPVAVEDIDKIIKFTDSIMIARGDLGVEISPEKVPGVQKRIIQICNKRGCPVITATQMLDSMENSPKPTRAEASDVANAILDGTDAVMLSGETASGKYPVKSVEMMRKIILETESEMGYGIRPWSFFEMEESSVSEAISYSACQVARAVDARAICCFTQSGAQAGRISKFRPEHPIIAITYDARMANRVCLLWGVVPIQIPAAEMLDDEIVLAEEILLNRKWALESEKIVITGGIPMHISGTTNVVKVHYMSDMSTLEKSYIFKGIGGT
jgi:pyruvate kinase